MQKNPVNFSFQRLSPTHSCIIGVNLVHNHRLLHSMPNKPVCLSCDNHPLFVQQAPQHAILPKYHKQNYPCSQWLNPSLLKPSIWTLGTLSMERDPQSERMLTLQLNPSYGIFSLFSSWVFSLLSSFLPNCLMTFILFGSTQNAFVEFDPHCVKSIPVNCICLFLVLKQSLLLHQNFI